MKLFWQLVLGKTLSGKKRAKVIMGKPLPVFKEKMKTKSQKITLNRL